MSLWNDSRLPNRFWDKVKQHPESGCWEWIASRNPKGYGVYYAGPTVGMRHAHRVAFCALVFEPPEGYTVDHLCRNRGCCNPEHLEAVPHIINVRRGLGSGSRTHCPQGHPYAGGNLHIQSNGARRCLTCRRNHSRAYKARQRTQKLTIEED